MDFDLSANQAKLLDELATALAEPGATDRAHECATAGTFDRELDASLVSRGLYNPRLDRLSAALLTQEAGRSCVSAPVGLRALILSSVGLDPLDSSIVPAVAERFETAPVRFASVATHLISLDDEGAFVRPVQAGEVAVIDSSFGFPYGRLAADGGDRVEVDAAEIRRRWALAVAAEMAGLAAAGLDHTAKHLVVREQFGKPLAALQALRHRHAEVAVSVEALSWLTREAAFHGDETRVGVAANYAQFVAASAVGELVQLCGSRSFTLEFGLQPYVMRVEALRLELGRPTVMAERLLSTLTDAMRLPLNLGAGSGS